MFYQENGINSPGFIEFPNLNNNNFLWMLFFDAKRKSTTLSFFPQSCLNPFQNGSLLFPIPSGSRRSRSSRICPAVGLLRASNFFCQNGVVTRSSGRICRGKYREYCRGKEMKGAINEYLSETGEYPQFFLSHSLEILFLLMRLRRAILP